jgi:FMN phosphatase YigB (HAD superfamily)
LLSPQTRPKVGRHPRIEAVLFDLDGTLRHNQPNGYSTLIEYLAELGYPLPDDIVRAGHRWTHRYWSISPDLKEDLEEFAGENRGFWARHTQRQLQALGLGLNGDLPALAEQISAMFRERYQPRHHIPDEVRPTLRGLRQAGYTLGLVSNRTDPLEALVVELGLAGEFDFTLSAGEAQSWKPDAGIFRAALQLAGCLPAAAAYVGDNYYADVLGAREAGLCPILIDPHGVFPDPGCTVIHNLAQLQQAIADL